MFRRDVFILIAATLVGSVAVFCASLGDTPFFPASLQTSVGECPKHGPIPAHWRPILEPDEASWFGHRLQALHENPLAPPNAAQEATLRFTLLANGGVATTVRVVEAEDGRFHLTGKWLKPCRDEGGCLVEKLLSPAEQERLEAAVKPLLRVPSYGCYGPVDSDISIMEIRDEGTYRMWYQLGSPNGELGATGVVLLQLAGWPLAGNYRPSGSAALRSLPE
ncbi:hypothetical protein D3C71_278960 [compost metagenome]